MLKFEQLPEYGLPSPERCRVMPTGTALGVPNNVDVGTLPQIPTNYLPTSSGANMNSHNAALWTVWNVTYVQQIITANSVLPTDLTPNTLQASSMATSASITNSAINGWGAWNMQFSAATSGMNATNQLITPAGTTNGITQQVWVVWNQPISNIRTASPEQVREQQRRVQEQYQEQRARVRAERSLADERAEKLLQEQLSAKQREDLAAKGFFELETISQSGERRIYRIKRGRTGNVEQVDGGGHRLKRFCIHPIANVPDADTMLAQKLMLETQEEDFLRIANHS